MAPDGNLGFEEDRILRFRIEATVVEVHGHQIPRNFEAVVDLERLDWALNSGKSVVIPSFVAEITAAVLEASTVISSFVVVPEAGFGIQKLKVVIVVSPIDLTKVNSVTTVEPGLTSEHPQSTVAQAC